MRTEPGNFIAAAASARPALPPPTRTRARPPPEGAPRTAPARGLCGLGPGPGPILTSPAPCLPLDPARGSALPALGAEEGSPTVRGELPLTVPPSAVSQSRAEGVGGKGRAVPSAPQGAWQPGESTQPQERFGYKGQQHRGAESRLS